MAVRYNPVGKTQYCNRNTELESRTLHTVHQVRHDMPPRGNSREVLQERRTKRRSGRIQTYGVPLQGQSGLLVHNSGCTRRLHRLRLVRDCLPRKEQNPGGCKSPYDGRPRTSARSGRKELRILPQTAESR